MDITAILGSPDMMRVINGFWVKGSWTLAFIGSVFVFTVVYTALTPCHEWQMLNDPKKANAAFASLAGAILGFAFPVLVSIAQNHQWSKFFLAATSSAVLQIVLYTLISIGARGWRKRMNEGEVAAGKMLGLWWIIGGLGIAAANIG